MQLREDFRIIGLEEIVGRINRDQTRGILDPINSDQS